MTGAAEDPLPDWVPRELYPFQSRYLDIDGSRVHYIDEGSGPTLLLLHGNPTWSFLYRRIVLALRGSFRCVALDYPGFGLSGARPGYSFKPAEHANVLERAVLELDLSAITMMVQDWGGPIGFAVATRHPERFSAFVIGNTWAWPKSDPGTQAFSRLVGGPLGGLLIRRGNFFVERVLPSGVRSGKLSAAVMDAYRGPFPDAASREPTHVFPHEILASRSPFLADLERDLHRVTSRPALLVWPTGDFAFREPERRRWESLFADHTTVLLHGAGHYIQEDAPQQIIDAILDWSAGREP